ncbi:MAG: hypothetical protein ABIJ65_14660 [Chloroflexota bacterium]
MSACDRYAQDGKVRLLNQSYVADGIYFPNAAHAKVIMLTKHDEGKLLIGSGNLGIQGYTSGGEMFTYYHYHKDQKETLSAFRSIWEFVSILLQRGVVGEAAWPYLKKIYETTPWLMQMATEDSLPVRHNLDISFLEQLKQELGKDQVQELWILSPFYDQKAVALAQLIEVFDPSNVNLIIQPNYISVEKKALQKVIDNFPGKINILLCDEFTDSDPAYIHTKLYILKMADRSVCLQGSPNCSQVALLLPSPKGNIEISNMISGDRDAFDDLLQPLNLSPPVLDLSSLELHFELPEPEVTKEEPWLLTGARWHEESLYLFFQTDAPDLDEARLIIGGFEFKALLLHREGRILEIRLPTKAQELLSTSFSPISLEIGDWKSSRVFSLNVDALAREAQEDHHEILVYKIENFDIDDPEIENLLRELEASIPIDRQSIWQLAGRTLPEIEEDDDSAYQLDYADINYDLLRMHPKIQQYSQDRFHSGAAFGQTRLQEILSAITAHFQGLTDLAYPNNIFNKVLPKTDEADDVGEEDDVIIEEIPERRPVNQPRIRRILKHFIRRYLRGLQSKDFIELVGADVMVNNYIIFAHILWRLMQKEWVELDFIIKANLQLWTFMWGEEGNEGYYASLDEDIGSRALESIIGQKSDALVIATLFFGDYKCRIAGWIDLRLDLRDFWRNILTEKPILLNIDLCLNAWIFIHGALPYQTPTPTLIVSTLETLSNIDTKTGFLSRLERNLGLKENSCKFVQNSIFRESTNQTVQMDCLEISDETAITCLNDAKGILNKWMQYGLREFFRISTPKFIFLYDTLTRKGVFLNCITKECEEIEKILLPSSEIWKATLIDFFNSAKYAEDVISLKKIDIKNEIVNAI